jgi:hypothetical protein
VAEHARPKTSRWRRPKRLWVVAIAVLSFVVIGSGTGYAVEAATTSPVHHAAFFACVSGNGAGQVTGPITGHPLSCPTGQILAEDNNVGPSGSPGAKGTAGPVGPTGPPGAQRATAPPTAVVVPGTTLTTIGGSFSTGHTVIGTDSSLSAGTYLVTLTGDFYKHATTTATPDLQIQLNGASSKLTAYTDQFPANAAEGVGLGTDGTPNGLELTATVSGVVTVTADQPVEFDAFGYNADRGGEGGGDFGVITTVSFTPEG